MNTKVNLFNSSDILRLTPIKSDTISVADNIINGKCRIFPTLPEIDVENLGQLWEFIFPAAQSTYSLYTYALYPVSYLLNAYELSGKKQYLDEALDLSEKFCAWLNSSDKKINNKRQVILWGDHAVSNRTQALCYLVACLYTLNEVIPSFIRVELLTHGEYLSDIRNYSSYNHGLMMDLSLLGLVNTLKGIDEDFPVSFQVNLLERLQKSLTRDITEDGVHIENSIGYHFWILKFFEKIYVPLSIIDKELSVKCKKSLDKAKTYAQYVTRSDGTIPAIGDTHANLKGKPSFSLGSRIFSNSNIVIFRDLDDKFWASFYSGYKTHVHKHKDDGSFNLFYKGHEVFFDPGFLNYENEEDSLMIKSASFHNTVKPVNEEMDIIKQSLDGEYKVDIYKNNLSESRLIGFYSDNLYEASLAIISGYVFGTIERLVIFNRKGYFIIYDRVIGNADHHTFEQGFNIGNNLEISFKNSISTVISTNIGEDLCDIKRFSRSFDENDNKIEVKDSFYAGGFNLKKQCQRIIFNFKEKDSLLLVRLLNYSSTDKDISLSSKEVFKIVDSIKQKFQTEVET